MTLLIGPFKPRPSRERSAGLLALHTLLQILVVWGLALYVVPSAIVWAEWRLGLSRAGGASLAERVLGAVLFILGSALGLSAAHVMIVRGRGTPLPARCAPQLVVAGPYRHVRNPMAIGGVSQALGIGLYVGSPATVTYALLGAAIWQWMIRPGEERDLALRFGAAYFRYRSRVRCWLPGRGYRDDPSER